MTAAHAERQPSVFRNLRHALLGWGLPVLAALLTTPIVVRALGTEPYGLYALVVGLGGQVLGLGLGRALTRHVAAAQACADSARVGALISAATLLAGLLGLLSALVLVLASPWISMALKLDAALQTQARDALLLTALAFPVAAWTQVFGALPQALQRFDLAAAVTNGLALSVAALNVVLATRGHGVVALLAANLVATALGCLAALLVARRLLPEVRFTVRVQPALLRELTRFSGAVLGYQACGLLLLLWERLYLTRALGPAALTHYVVPMGLAVQFHAAVASATALLVPLSSAALASLDGARLRTLYERGLRLVLALVTFFVVGTLATERTFLVAWMGAPFADQATDVLTLQALTFGLLALGTVPWHVAEALERPSWNAAFALTWLLVAGPLLLVMTPAWGLTGAAAARLLGLLLGLPMLVMRVERAVFGAPRVALWATLLLRLVLPGVALYGLLRLFVLGLPSARVSLLLAALLAPPGFVAALWLGGYLRAEDRAWLRARLRAQPREQPASSS